MENQENTMGEAKSPGTLVWKSKTVWWNGIVMAIISILPAPARAWCQDHMEIILGLVTLINFLIRHFTGLGLSYSITSKT